jgi:hypothetical protein
MKHKYDLFERFPDGSSLWRACVVGLEGARNHMSDLAKRSSNRFYAMHVSTGKIVLPEFAPGRLGDASKSRNHSSAAAA